MLEGQGKGQGSNDNENLTAMEFLMMQMGNEQQGMSKGNSPVPGNTGGGSSQGGSTDEVTKSLRGSTLSPTKNNSSSKGSSSSYSINRPRVSGSNGKILQSNRGLKKLLKTVLLSSANLQCRGTGNL